jgi:hypothetical protein
MVPKWRGPSGWAGGSGRGKVSLGQAGTLGPFSAFGVQGVCRAMARQMPWIS